MIKNLLNTILKKLPFYKLFFLIFFFFIFSTISYSSLEAEEVLEEIDPYCNGIDFYSFSNAFQNPPKKIKILIPQSKDYYENLVNASVTGNYINERFKRQFSGFIEIEYGDFSCKFKAHIRISGDWKDHIDLDNYISSLDIRLLEGNIQGITKFKLFLPKTRNFDNEIFVTTLIREFGILSPRTFNVNVNFNNYFEGTFIFQEKIVKELIEKNNLRESLIIESDETYVWQNSKDPYYRNMDEDSKKNMFISGKYLNQLWVSRNQSNYNIYKSAVGLFNRAIFSSNNNRFNLKAEGFNTFEMSKFETLSIALKFRHATVPHNRKFYFDRLSDQFIPIYYDGAPLFLYNPKIESLNEKLINNEIISAAKILKKSKVNIEKVRKNLLLNGLNYSTSELEDLIENFYSNLDYIASQRTSYTDQRVGIKNNFLLDTQEKKAIFSYGEILKHCSKSSVIICKNFTRENHSLINSTIEENTIFFGDFEAFFYGNLNKLIKTTLNGMLLFSVEEPDYEYLEEENILNLKINNINQRYKIVFLEETAPLSIDLEILENIDSYISNNEFLLTGCLTIYNSEFKKLKIKVNNSFCEDALNIINSIGSIDLIEINRSDFDAVDIDYSHIGIKKININSANNDCIDLSKGTYAIDEIEASNCGDKGISIGENSQVKLNSTLLSNTKTALAVKDFSIVEVNNFETVNSDFCLKIYQKKQEFGPSKLSVKNFICDSGYFVQKGSVLEK